MLKLGIHVSIAGKIYKSAERAADVGCNTMQIFSRNPRQLRNTSLDEEDIKIFRKKVKQAKIDPVVVHIPYTLNLASSKHSFYKITIREFIIDLLEVDKLGAKYLVTHMGSFKGGTEKGGLLRVANALNKILKETKGVKTKILLENTSGSGCWLGYKFSHHKFILERLNDPKRVGVCLDTAHTWAAGYNIRDLKGINAMLDEIKSEIGINKIKVVHLNDTKEDLNSLRDRHANIGQGQIGKNGFSRIINHPMLRNVPFILETPKDCQGDDLDNLNIIRSLYKDGLHKEN